MQTSDQGQTRIIGKGAATAAGPTDVMAADTLEGDKVYTTDGDDVGKIKDIMLDVRSGRVAYAVLSSGGILGIGDKLHAIPWSALTLDTERNASCCRCRPSGSATHRGSTGPLAGDGRSAMGDTAARVLRQHAVLERRRRTRADRPDRGTERSALTRPSLRAIALRRFTGAAAPNARARAFFAGRRGRPGRDWRQRQALRAMPQRVDHDERARDAGRRLG